MNRLKESIDPVNLEMIKKKFRELGIPEEHVNHVMECESCYKVLVKHLKTSKEKMTSKNFCVEI